MTLIRQKWEEFLTVIDFSPDTEIAIVAVLVIPTLVWVGGAWLTSHLELTGPVATLYDAVLARLDLVFAVLAMLLYWRLAALAVTSYRRARSRWLGGP